MLVSWFWQRRFFFILRNVFLLFRNYLPFEKGGPFIWTNFPITYGCFVLRLVGKIGQVDLAKVFKNFVNVFFLIRNYRTLQKGGALHLNKFESPPLQGCIVPSWLYMIQWFWRRWKCEKLTTMDKFWSEKSFKNQWIYKAIYLDISVLFMWEFLI